MSVALLHAITLSNYRTLKLIDSFILYTIQQHYAKTTNMMSLFKKMNFKDQKAIVVLNQPDSFNQELSTMKEFSDIIVSAEKVKAEVYAIEFVKTEQEIEEAVKLLTAKLVGDVVMCFCYLKNHLKYISARLTATPAGIYSALLALRVWGKWL